MKAAKLLNFDYPDFGNQLFLVVWNEIEKIENSYANLNENCRNQMQMNKMITRMMHHDVTTVYQMAASILPCSMRNPSVESCS